MRQSFAPGVRVCGKTGYALRFKSPAGAVDVAATWTLTTSTRTTGTLPASG